MIDLKKARRQYVTQKHNAIRRGIDFELTFEQWIEFWGENWDKRGRGKEQLVMRRFNDSGPYKVGNIVLRTPLQNAHDRPSFVSHGRDRALTNTERVVEFRHRLEEQGLKEVRGMYLENEKHADFKRYIKQMGATLESQP